MLETVNFEVALVKGGEAIRVEVFYKNRTITAYIEGYILNDLGSVNALTLAKRAEQYLTIFNENQDFILEKIVEKFNRNEQITLHLIRHDLIKKVIQT
jgi:hypothetical protein